MWAKLLLLAIAAVVVWYLFKFANRPRKREGTPAIERTIKCPSCGVYVPMVSAEPCGRDGCPYLVTGASGAP
jgi:hypothetical protein